MMKNVTICLNDLFNSSTHNPEEEIVRLEKDGYIRKEIIGDTEYYDLIINSGEIACMDGETCEILDENNDFIRLQELDERVPFVLSRKEFNMCSTPTTYTV